MWGGKERMTMRTQPVNFLVFKQEQMNCDQIQKGCLDCGRGEKQNKVIVSNGEKS